MHRNIILTVLTGLAGILVVLLGVFTWFYWQEGLIFQSWRYDLRQDFWLLSGSGGSLSLLWELIKTGLLSFFGLIAGFLVRRRFQRSASTESFFLALWFYLLTLEVLRLAIPLMSSAGLSFLYPALLSRVLTGVRWVQLLLMIGAGLYTLGFDYQKHGQVLLIILGLGLVMAFTWPLDTQVMTSGMMVHVAQEGSLVFVQGILMILPPLMYCAAAVQQGEPRRYMEAGSMFLLILGRLATGFESLMLPGLLVLLLGIGALFLGRKREEDWS